MSTASRLSDSPRAWLALLFAVTCCRAMAGAESPTSGFAEFTSKVQQYVKMQKAVERKQSRLRTTKLRQEIVSRREALAGEIHNARPGAVQGDIFTPDATVAFRDVIRRAFQGPGARGVRDTVNQGEPLRKLKPEVNGVYPEDIPFTSVPPTLLRMLPRLPDEVAYRIAGHDFILQDVKARLIVDFIPGALP